MKASLKQLKQKKRTEFPKKEANLEAFDNTTTKNISDRIADRLLEKIKKSLS